MPEVLFTFFRWISLVNRGKAPQSIFQRCYLLTHSGDFYPHFAPLVKAEKAEEPGWHVFLGVQSMITLKSFILIEQDRQYLLVKESSFKWRGKWFLPGGSVKKNESPEAALRRETKEEAGVLVEIKGLFYIRCFQGFWHSQLHLFYTGRILEGQVKTKANKHSMGARWLTYEEAIQLPARDHLEEIIEAYHKTSATIPTHNFKIIQE